jgi:hypothetical protein
MILHVQNESKITNESTCLCAANFDLSQNISLAFFLFLKLSKKTWKSSALQLNSYEYLLNRIVTWDFRYLYSIWVLQYSTIILRMNWIIGEKEIDGDP